MLAFRERKESDMSNRNGRQREKDLDERSRRKVGKLHVSGNVSGRDKEIYNRLVPRQCDAISDNKVVLSGK